MLSRDREKGISDRGRGCSFGRTCWIDGRIPPFQCGKILESPDNRRAFCDISGRRNRTRRIPEAVFCGALAEF